MPYLVYILYSEKLNRFYVGTTDDAERRLLEHNTAHYQDAYTVKGIPWTIYLTIACTNSEQAYKLERFIKKMKSSVFIQKLKDVPGVLESVLAKI
ncbi:GIY-YIG nuclease family protein [Flavisolibacter tropicus]|uniref:GIY-YIG domain-containing protein n=1 Tax=Flavisolibacter tropicus TaxID=1492898 RepID=A0A172U0L8_9BACT|nr:GIY-YIG nuclease family protein [Flavisolibacter tropicus]ANE52537.1 hypothetical protein SY85_20695 [Flavisolibacter tropicus]ANE52538.1 hypothetical protein SY85_20700 [Flavisolibacter tropicus]